MFQETLFLLKCVCKIYIHIYMKYTCVCVYIYKLMSIYLILYIHIHVCIYVYIYFFNGKEVIWYLLSVDELPSFPFWHVLIWLKEVVYLHLLTPEGQEFLLLCPGRQHVGLFFFFFFFATTNQTPHFRPLSPDGVNKNNEESKNSYVGPYPTTSEDLGLLFFLKIALCVWHCPRSFSNIKPGSQIHIWTVSLIILIIILIIILFPLTRNPFINF